jgi:hypothetical protein
MCIPKITYWDKTWGQQWWHYYITGKPEFIMSVPNEIDVKVNRKWDPVKKEYTIDLATYLHGDPTWRRNGITKIDLGPINQIHKMVLTKDKDKKKD